MSTDDRSPYSGTIWNVPNFNYTVSYYCSDCDKKKAALEEQQRLCDHLRSQINQLNNNNAVLKQRLVKQSNTIQEKLAIINDLRAKLSTASKLRAALSTSEEKLKATERELDCRTQDFDAIIKMQSETIKELRKEPISLEHCEHCNRCTDTECCDCCDCPTQKRPDEAYKLMNLQNRIEEQNRIIGAKQEEINNLKIELAKAKETVHVKQIPDTEIIRSFEDKIARLIDVVNSKDVIIKGLQEFISKNN